MNITATLTEGDLNEAVRKHVEKKFPDLQVLTITFSFSEGDPRGCPPVPPAYEAEVAMRTRNRFTAANPKD